MTSSKILFAEYNSLTTDNPMSTCYTLKCSKISSNDNFDTYDISKPMQTNIYDYKYLLLGCRSIYLYKVYKGNIKKDLQNKFNQLMKIPNKYFIIQDMHRKTYGNIVDLCKLLNDNKINIVFTFYNNAEASYIRKLTPDVSHHHLHLHIDKNIFNYNDEKKDIDILLFGSIHPIHYPFRKRLFELILNNKQLMQDYNIVCIEKPNNFDPDKCEQGLANLISRSKFCISTKSKYDYLVGKYFEITLCKSIIMGNIATDGKSIFNDNYASLNEIMTDEDIIKQINMYINKYNNGEYEEIINVNYEMVKDNFELDKCVDKILKIIL